MGYDAAQDWSKLQQRYSSMSDEELLDLADEQDQLTEMAQETLRAEMSTRRLHNTAASIEMPGDEQERFVLITQQNDLSNAIFLQAALESLDIETRIEDQDSHTLAWFIEHQADGISLFVRAKQVGAAMEVLKNPYGAGGEEPPEEP